MIQLFAHASGGAEGGGSALASWAPLYIMLIAFGAAVLATFVFGRSGDHPNALARFLLRPADAMERLTRSPGWAVSTVGVGMYGLFVAGYGFYSDVSWHIALGRDEELFTAPHTAIVIGLGLIAGSSILAVLFTTLGRIPVGFRLWKLQVPWSALPLGALGLVAVSGFPMDELWHAAYGIDVTMWSPTHMLMIMGAALSGIASWLVVGEAGVDPRGNPWQRGFHYVAAWLTLQGLLAPMGEFSFGVPQFQHLYHPVLLTIASAFAFTAMRLALGAKAMVGVALVTFAFDQLDVLGGGGDMPADTRSPGILLGSLVAVLLVGALVGTDNRLRFAVASGLGAATLGLAAEFVYNQGARQPWRMSLLPDAVLVSALAGVAAAVLATGLCIAIIGKGARPIRGAVFAGAAVALLVALLLPLPRNVGDVVGEVTLDKTDDGHATVDVRLDPPNAADDARWFQVSTWQGGNLELAEMEEVEPGHWRSEEPVTIEGSGKTLLRLHRADQLMTIPIRLPADPEIDEPEIRAEDRTMAFAGEKDYLMRETFEGSSTMTYVIGAVWLLVIALWTSTFAVAVNRIDRGGRGGTGMTGDPGGQDPEVRSRRLEPSRV